MKVSAAIVALRLGRVALAFLPGEPFAETGNAIRARSQFELTGIVGFSEETIGYIPTDNAFAEGGYETGFGAWSHLSPGCEPIVRENAVALLHQAATAHPASVPRATSSSSNGTGAHRPAAMTGQSLGALGGGDDA